MRILALIVALLSVVSSPAARGESPPYQAGVGLVQGTADAPIDAMVRYPTLEVERTTTPNSNPQSPAAAPAPAEGRFPVVLLSHGGGTTGGSPRSLGGLSVALARQGFIVVAPFHGITPLQRRTGQVVRALDAALADRRFASHMDPARLGMLGFSLGGAVTLELAGARPDGLHFLAYCETHPDDFMSCDQAPGGRKSERGERPADPPRLPLKAIVLLDPLAALFQRDGLTAVTMPVLLVRPAQSQLSGEGNAFALATALPRAPKFSMVPGDHFILTDVCLPQPRSEAEPVCQDPSGVDRAAVQAEVAARIAKFFQDHL